MTTDLPYTITVEDFEPYPKPNQVVIRTAHLRFRRFAHGKMT